MSFMFHPYPYSDPNAVNHVTGRGVKPVAGIQNVAAKIAEGADFFYLGGYGGFDHMCASVLRELKKTQPQIRLILILPYLNSSMITEGYDETLYPPLESVPRRFAMNG